MSSRKAIVLWITVAVVLSVGLGTIIASETTVDNHTAFQVNDAGVDDESTLESGVVTATNISELTPQTVNFTDVFEDLEDYENPLIDYNFDTFPFGSGSESESKSKQGPNSDSNPGQGPNSDSNPGQGPNSDSNPGQGPNSEPEQEDSGDTESESESEAESEQNSEDTEPEQESEPEPDSEPEGNSDDTDSEPEPEPESEEDTEDTESDQEPESEQEPEPESESEPEGDAENIESGSDQDPGTEENADDTGSSSESSGFSSGLSAGSGGSDSAEQTVTTTETADSVTIHVDDANGESIVQSLDLAEPSETDPGTSLSTLEIDPADREEFEITVERPTSDPSESPAVPHGEALAYVDLEANPDVNGTTTLSFEVDPVAIPDGLGIEAVEVLRDADGEWTAAGVTHDVDEETHRVTLSEVSSIAVVALEPGRIEIVDADVPADWVRAGYETKASVTVRNAGDRPETDTVAVAMDGEPVAERNVSLDPDETATVELAFEPTDSGTVTLNGTEIGTLTVADGNEADENDAAAEPATAEDMPGFGPLSVVLALLVAVLITRLRHKVISRRF